MGIIATIPFAGKVAGKPYMDRSGEEKRCPRGHLFGVLAVLLKTVPGPYSWGPDLAKGAGP